MLATIGVSIGSKVVKNIDIGSKGKKNDKGKKDSKGKSNYEFNIDIGSINIEFIFNIEQLARERIGSGQSSGGEPNTTGKSKITSSTIADYVTIATGAFAFFTGLASIASKALGNKEQANNSTGSTTDSPGSVLYITGDALVYGTTSTTPPGSTAGSTGNVSNDTATLAEKTNESLLQIAEYFNLFCTYVNDGFTKLMKRSAGMIVAFHHIFGGVMKDVSKMAVTAGNEILKVMEAIANVIVGDSEIKENLSFY